MIVTSTFGKERLLALDALRGIAALIVATGHAELLGTHDYALCVVFFYILSGYVLTYAYGDAVTTGKMTIAEFAVMRFARLYPLHIVTAAFVGVLWTCAVLFLHHQPPDLTPVELIETLTLTQSLFSGSWSLDLPSWSIGAEFWCGFLLLPLLWPQRRYRAAAVLAGVGLFIAADINGGFIAAVAGRYCIAAGCFVIGWALHFINFRKGAWLGWPIALCAFVATMFSPVSADGRPLVELIYVVAFAAVVFFLARAELPNRTRWVASLLGDLSYGIYLWHWPLLRLIPHATAPQFSVFLVCLFVVSWLSFKFVELPAKRAIRSYARHAGTARVDLISPSR